MTARKRVILSGYYGFDNSGDDAILKAVVKDLRRAKSNLEITAFSNKPESTEENYGIRAVNRFSVFGILRELYRTDMLISGGGSLLQDISSTRSIIYYLTLIYIAKLFHKPVMVYANGIGPINRKFNRILTKKILNKVDIITLRDNNSQKTLEEIGVENRNVYVTSDPVFTLDPSDETRVNDILNKENIPTNKPLVGISIREWKGASNLQEIISQTIDYLATSYDVNVVLIPMHYPEDLEISEEVFNLSKSNCYIISGKYNVEDMMGIIKKLDIIIAMRLHSLIYAATQAVPMIGLVYDPKVEGFLELVGLDYKCDVSKLELIELCTLIDKMWNNKDDIKSKLKKVTKKLSDKSLENVKMALNVLKSR